MPQACHCGRGLCLSVLGPRRATARLPGLHGPRGAAVASHRRSLEISLISALPSGDGHVELSLVVGRRFLL